MLMILMMMIMWFSPDINYLGYNFPFAITTGTYKFTNTIKQLSIVVIYYRLLAIGEPTNCLSLYYIFRPGPFDIWTTFF